jgi:hypothetical protein
MDLILGLLLTVFDQNLKTPTKPHLKSSFLTWFGISDLFVLILHKSLLPLCLLSTNFEVILCHIQIEGQTQARLKCVLGSSLTHMMTHGTESNVTSLLNNRGSVQNS